jgi:hypothetical protein
MHGRGRRIGGGEARADANGATYVLLSVDSTNYVIGLNDQGRYLQGLYGPATRFRLAALDKYIPTDPCRQWAVNYNTYYGTNDTTGFFNTLVGMASNSCKVKALVDQASSIKSFQPVP